MNPLPNRSRLALALLCTFTCTSAAREARADSAETCIAAHANGQEQRKTGSLIAARASFATCAADACPDVIRSECVALAREVESVMPSVVLAVPASVDARSVTARVDAAPEALPLDGTPVLLEPGNHQITFVTADGHTDTQALTLREGEKSRRIEARFQAPATTEAPASPGFRVPVLTYVFGGAAVLATGSFTYFALKGRSNESDLDTCAPRCDRDAWSEERDSMRRNYLIADVSLGVALASLGLGAFFLFDAQSPSTTAPEAGASVGVSGGVEPGGFRVLASGRF